MAEEPSTLSRHRGLILSFLRFGMSGLPGFVVALAVNVLLVKRLGWPKPAAYALVVWLQMTSGFLMCRYVVFHEGSEVPALRAYFQFAGSMGLIRVVDWTLYTTAVELLGIPFLVAQICTTGLFIVIKFFSAKAIFSKN